MQMPADNQRLIQMNKERHARVELRFRDREAGDEGLCVVCEADAVHAVSLLEFTCSYQRRLVVARDDFVVDSALDLVTSH